MVKIRRAYEVLFLGLFLFFLLITDLRYLKGWPVSLFLEATPLVAVSTALTTHTIYRNLVWGLLVIAVTMMLGRVWCNWMCPFGILHHLFGWIGNRPRDDDKRPAHRRQGHRERLQRAPRVLAGVGGRADLHRLFGGELVDTAVLLPRDLSARGAARGVQPVRALADRPRPGALHG